MIVVAAAAGLWWYFHLVNRAVAINSIAILPFVNAGGNNDVDDLSDGLTESLITSLSQLPKLSVKARSSVFPYKGKDVSPGQIGKELNVQAVLNGRVVQRGNNLTMHIELVDVKTEIALWSGDYSRSMTNIVSLPGEIARDVSRKQAQAVLDDLEAIAAKIYVPAYDFALIHVGLGEKHEALKYLEKAFQEREVGMVFIKTDERWDDLRVEPRFQDLLRRVGFKP